MLYSVRHATTFGYSPAIRESVMEVRMQPRNEASQRCMTFSLDITPTADILDYRDYLGNTIHHFDIPGRHTKLKIIAQSLVDVKGDPAPTVSAVSDWAALDDMVAKGDYWEMLLPSHFARPTQRLMDLAQELHLKRSANPFEVLCELNEALYTCFEYVPNSTQVDSPIDDALFSRQGVCQDFSHIMLALVRQLGIPCRYVSGYLFQRAGNHDRSQDGASHAWVEALLPGPGWVSFDPTNNLLGGERHIRVAIGRDYADVPPTRGVYKGEAENELSVAVQVLPAEAPRPEQIFPATVFRSKPRAPASMDALHHEQQQQQ